MLEYQNRKLFLEKLTLQIWASFVIKNVKNTVILTEKKLLELFTKKNCKTTNQKGFRIEKIVKRRDINYMLNGKDTIVYLIAGSIKKHSISEWNFSKTKIFRRKFESWTRLI